MGSQINVATCHDWTLKLNSHFVFFYYVITKVITIIKVSRKREENKTSILIQQKLHGQTSVKI